MISFILLLLFCVCGFFCFVFVLEQMRGLRPAEPPDLLKVVKLVIGRTGFEQSCVSCRLSDFFGNATALPAVCGREERGPEGRLRV